MDDETTAEPNEPAWMKVSGLISPRHPSRGMRGSL
jgi:hypothetical protein